jgi:hypothetical protein
MSSPYHPRHTSPLLASTVDRTRNVCFTNPIINISNNEIAGETSRSVGSVEHRSPSINWGNIRQRTFVKSSNIPTTPHSKISHKVVNHTIAAQTVDDTEPCRTHDISEKDQSSYSSLSSIPVPRPVPIPFGNKNYPNKPSLLERTQLVTPNSEEPKYTS